MSIVVILGDPDHDALVDSLANHFTRWGQKTKTILPSETATAPWIVGKDVLLNHESVCAVIDRCAAPEPLCRDFAATDVDFVHAEARALLFEVLSHPGVATVNRVDAVTWFATSTAWVWRARLRALGIEVSPLFHGGPLSDHSFAHGAFGAGEWLTHSGTLLRAPAASVRAAMGTAIVEAGPKHTKICCAGDIVGGGGCPNIDAAAGALFASGILLAALTVDEHGRIILVDTMPTTEDWRLADFCAARLSSEVLHAAVCR